MFTKEIEEALAEGRVDLAVHSLKDLPTELSPGFEIAAITKRENPQDVFCSVKYDSIDALAAAARASAPAACAGRRSSRRLRPDLEIHPLRGNVDTRLRKLEEGEYDAIILAAAGLNRLGKTELVKQVIPEDSCVRRRDRAHWESRFAPAIRPRESIWPSSTTRLPAPPLPASARC